MKSLLLLSLMWNIVYPQKNDTQAALRNIGTNALIGSIGAMVNKKPDEKLGKVFLKGFYQGALGGYLTFESKRLVRQFSKTDNYAYLWPSKILNSAGNSITYNAASNRDFWERWHISFGFNYIEYDLKAKRRLRYRVLPFALYGNIDGFIKGRLDFRRTLYSGHFIFENNDLSSSNVLEPRAQALANTIQLSLLPGLNIEENLAHEIIHVYQYNGFFPVNAFLNDVRLKAEHNHLFFQVYNKVFLTDINYLVLNGVRGLQSLSGADYEDLYIEKEARYYSVINTRL